MKDIINTITEIGQCYFHESKFNLKQINFTTWIIEGNSSAFNYHKTDVHKVKVLNWFNDFWLFFGIRFIKVNNEYKSWGKDKRDEFINLLNNQFLKFEEDFFQTFITLSVFQGNTQDDAKTQLFRAEWDNYENLSENHPQPHWHIYPHKYTKKLHDDFEDFIELTKTYDDFKEYTTNKRDANIIDLKKLHFAMNGQWSENKNDVHKIENENDLKNWFSGILNHIRKELLNIIEK